DLGGWGAIGAPAGHHPCPCARRAGSGVFHAPVGCHPVSPARCASRTDRGLFRATHAGDPRTAAPSVRARRSGDGRGGDHFPAGPLALHRRFGRLRDRHLCLTDHAVRSRFARIVLRRGDEIVLPAMRIADSPRFRWRGLMLDSARHYQSPEFIMRLIDWMALHKLNVLQWHLTDDQAWRLQIRKYPLLTSVGAWRLPAGPAAAADIDPGTGKPRLYGGYYTQEMVRQIVAHAAERYVTIVPEIDVPGHATAA